MSTYNEQLQTLWHQFEAENEARPATPREVVAWAMEKRLLEAPKVDPVSLLAEDMARAMREEYGVDRHGRRYRKNHAIRITRDGVQMSLWAELHSAPHDHMLKAFAQRRKQIVGDCVQLKVDVDVYSDAHPEAEPIQMVLDFTDDVAKVQAMSADNDRAAWVALGVRCCACCRSLTTTCRPRRLE